MEMKVRYEKVDDKDVSVERVDALVLDSLIIKQIIRKKKISP